MYISFDDFKKLDLRVAKIIEAEAIADSEKLIKLRIDLGNNEERQIIAGIRKTYNPENLVDKKIVVVANLEPRFLMGIESQGMLLAASGEDGPVLLVPDKDAEPGSTIS